MNNKINRIKNALFYPLLAVNLIIFGLVFYYLPIKPQAFLLANSFVCTFLNSPKTALNTITELITAPLATDDTAIPNFIFHTFKDEKPLPQAPASPPENSGIIEEIQYPTGGEGDRFIKSGAGYIRNLTGLSSEEISQEVMQTLPFEIELNSDAPQVLIMHSHATESYEAADLGYFNPQYNARSTDLSQNMTAVGAVITEVLNKNGINTLHDTTLHDYPNYPGSYERSYVTVSDYLAKYPSIKVVLDVHRDAIERDGKRMKPTCVISDKKAAQLMIICGADDGTMGMPSYKQNLRFASLLQNQMESMYPGLTRPVLFDYRKYNQCLTTGSLLLEFGGHANTLEEAKYSAQLVGNALVQLFTPHKG